MSFFVPDWHFAGLSSEIPEERITQITVDEKMICLLKREEKIFAFTAHCPHAGAALCEGQTDAKGNIVCPLHHYRFNPANGYNSSGEGYKLKTYPLRVNEGRIFVQF